MITTCSEPGDAVGEHAAAARVELGEHVVEQQQRRAASELRLGEQQREQREALLALRAEAPQVAARPAAMRDVVEVRAEPGRRRGAGRRSSRASSAAAVGGSPS